MIKLVQEKKENNMQDNFTVIKNGLVLTLDKHSAAGYYTIILKNGKIFLIDCENKFSEKEFVSKNPDAVIIDAKDKLIMPGLFNSALNSSFSLCRHFLDKCNYENLRSWHSLILVENFISDNYNTEIMSDILNISYNRALKNGEVFINESSNCISKSILEKSYLQNHGSKQYHNLTAFDQNYPSSGFDDDRILNTLSLGLIADEELNNYSLSSLKKSLSQLNARFFVEASVSQNVIESVKKIFGKPLITVLSEMELVNSNTVVYNPTHINQIELDILKKKNASILISPSDYLNLAGRKIDIDELLFSGLNIIIGTGYTGSNILTELKVLSNIIPKSSLSYESVFKMATCNPSQLFGLSNVTGSIERNNSADMIFFSLNDLRNTVSIPEITGESLCEFVIKNLTIKDISNVIIKGEQLVIDSRLSGVNEQELIIKAVAISDKLYKAGKFIEYKEKYLMRERVNKISLSGNNESDDLEIRKSSKEIYVDMKEMDTYEGEGEFSIKGKKEEEFEKSREAKTEFSEKVDGILDIKESGMEMDLISESDKLEQLEQISRNIKKIQKTEKQITSYKSADKETAMISEIKEDIRSETGNTKLIFDDIGEIEEIDGEIDREIEKEITDEAENEIADDSKPAFKKEKLKFGFRDGE
ncbi:MAG: amidohydrolase family protein [Ignavibacteria bacterium]